MKSSSTAHDRDDETLERMDLGRRFKNDTERLEKLFELYTRIDRQGPGEEGGEEGGEASEVAMSGNLTPVRPLMRRFKGQKMDKKCDEIRYYLRMNP